MMLTIHRFHVVAADQIAHVRGEEMQITLVERLRWNGELIVSTGRGYLLSRDTRLHDRLLEARTDFESGLLALRAEALPEPIADVEHRAREFMDIQQRVLDERAQAKDPGPAAQTFETELLPRQQQLEDALDRLVAYMEHRLEGVYEDAARSRDRLASQLYGLLVIILMAEVAFAVMFARQLADSYRHERAAVEAARKAVAARDEMIGIVAHDLRNPLGAITMRAALLREAPAVDIRAHAEGIEKVATRMEHLIGSMLDSSMIEAGQFAVTLLPCDAGSLLDEAIEALDPLARAKQIRLESAPPSAHLWIRADRERILEVLSNLVGNALKFTPNGGTVRLAVDADLTERAMVRFEVSDTGPGIHDEHLARVFDRYWKDPGGKAKGTGLGLYIARAIIDVHGGRIWAESTPGHGATFKFTLPLASDEAHPPIERRVLRRACN
ncbi:MAG TPA: HAMP domain-containing sensor histidine kinase [Kofleriaceae bacterium]|nr:HAMP domain-containing sensor histidine kinase [Kofleriaceae bacterium]